MRLFVSFRRLIPALLILVGLAACTPRPAGHSGEVFDPYEANNRQTHELNKAVDRAIVRPIATATSGTSQGGVGQALGNLATNLGEPSNALNHALQGDAQGTATAVARLMINTFFGLGGLFDIAGDTGLPEDGTDFGETLHVWGAPEGAYIELPVYGPSTERDAVGRIVDAVIDPLDLLIPAEAAPYATAIRLAGRVSGRGKFSDTVDSVLYDSVDSYAQARLIYLQNRRYELGGAEGTIDADAYADPYADPYQE